LGIGEDSWTIIKKDLFKEIKLRRDEYATLLGGYEWVHQLKRLVLMDEMSMVNYDTCHTFFSNTLMFSQASVNKWIIMPDMRYMIVSRYNVILVCLSLRQNIMIFSLRSKPLTDVSLNRVMCIGHVHNSYFVQVFSNVCGHV